MSRPKEILKRALRSAGLEVHRARKLAPRASLRGSLENIRSIGTLPSTVIDVGAADGTMELYETFPGARHFLIEPLVEFKDDLDALAKRFPGLRYVIAAAGSHSGEATLNVHSDLYGSSVLLEHEASGVNGVPRTVPSITLDEACAGLKPPFLVKLDVQGGELDVLAGGSEVLKATQWIVIETSFFGFFEGGPLFYDVIEYMHQKGFVLYDLFNVLHRPLDGATAQIDAVFVPQDSPLRKHHVYATSQQRQRLNRSPMGSR